MTINKFNYEAYALDYLEGTLSTEMVEEMERFLKTHPAIEAELSGMNELILLEPDTSVIYENKAKLLKSEKVVWLSKKWIRPFVVAASIALLMGTFYVGYQAGRNNQPNEMLVQEKAVPTQPSIESMDPIKSTVLPKAIEKEVKLEPAIASTVVAVTQEKKTEAINFEKTTNNSKTVQERTTAFAREQPVKNIQIADNGAQQISREKTNSVEIIKNELVSIQYLNSSIASIQSENDTLYNLQKALASTPLIDADLFVPINRKKRNIKNVLGRFPIQNLKEAIIPTYYKEDTAGQ